jgi:hypothetical protein
MSKKNPKWYDESKLVKIRFCNGDEDRLGETGWAVEIDRKKNLYRLANQPVFADANWGDLVIADDENGITEIVEAYEDEDGDEMDSDLENIQLVCKDCAQESLGKRFEGK